MSVSVTLADLRDNLLSLSAYTSNGTTAPTGDYWTPTTISPPNPWDIHTAPYAPARPWEVQPLGNPPMSWPVIDRPANGLLPDTSFDIVRLETKLNELTKTITNLSALTESVMKCVTLISTALNDMDNQVTEHDFKLDEIREILEKIEKLA